jgi:hypothetical protein
MTLPLFLPGAPRLLANAAGEIHAAEMVGLN